jgi:hypothetical protein
VVSHKTDGRVGQAIIDESIKHALGIGTAVDVVPEENANRVRCGMRAQIRIDPCENRFQKV